jgi:hypothetical protein
MNQVIIYNHQDLEEAVKSIQEYLENSIFIDYITYKRVKIKPKEECVFSHSIHGGFKSVLLNVENPDKEDTNDNPSISILYANYETNGESLLNTYIDYKMKPDIEYYIQENGYNTIIKISIKYEKNNIQEDIEFLITNYNYRCNMLF